MFAQDQPNSIVLFLVLPTIVIVLYIEDTNVIWNIVCYETEVNSFSYHLLPSAMGSKSIPKTFVKFWVFAYHKFVRQGHGSIFQYIKIA